MIDFPKPSPCYFIGNCCSDESPGWSPNTTRLYCQKKISLNHRPV